MNQVHVFLVPGLFNSGPEHWQTYWEKEFGFFRINQRDWDQPVCADWISHIQNQLLDFEPGEIILVGHSLGCCTIVKWAEKYQMPIRGALLVGPSDTEAPSYPPGTNGFKPMPTYRLPFPSLVVASTNDEYVSLERARHFAKTWGSRLVEAGPLGHINSLSGLGAWPAGIELLKQLF